MTIKLYFIKARRAYTNTGISQSTSSNKSGARGKAVELDGFPFSKSVFRLPAQHLHGNLAVVLGVP